jgi:hypothetical protein
MSGLHISEVSPLVKKCGASHFLTIPADRATHQFVSRGEISFLLRVNGNAMTGSGSAAFYDSQGRQVGGPLAATFEGSRMIP